MAQFGLPFSGNEIWVIPNNTQTNGFQTFLQNFGTQSIRSTILALNDYGDGNGGKKNITIFLSRDAAKDLMGGAAGTTPRTNVVGVSLHFGYDAVSSQVILVARSANNLISRPSGSEFNDNNYMSKAPSDTNANTGVTDSNFNTYTSGFRSSGYTFLTNLSNNAALSVKFDNQVLANLLYTNAPAISGQSEFHVVVAPPWNGESGQYLTVVAQGIDTSNAICYRGAPPCPKYCI